VLEEHGHKKAESLGEGLNPGGSTQDYRKDAEGNNKNNSPKQRKHGMKILASLRRAGRTIRNTISSQRTRAKLGIRTEEQDPKEIKSEDPTETKEGNEPQHQGMVAELSYHVSESKSLTKHVDPDDTQTPANVFPSSQSGADAATVLLARSQLKRPSVFHACVLK
jgi:hypothetical protein